MRFPKEPKAPPPHLEGKVVFVREVNLSFIPPARNAATLLARSGIPLIVVEYGREPQNAKREYLVTELPFAWVKRFPRRFRSPALVMSTILWFARQISRGNRPTLLVTHGLQEHVVGLVISVLYGIPHIVCAHEVYNLRDVCGWNRLYFLLERFALRRAATVIFPDPLRAAKYRERYHLECSVTVIPNYPLRVERFTPVDWRSRLRIPGDVRLIGYWGGSARTW